MAAQRLTGVLVSGACWAARGIRHWQFWTLRWPLRAYLLGVIAVAVVMASAAVATSPWHPFDLVICLALLGCGVIAIESCRSVREVQGTVVRDLQTVWYLAIAVTLPPAYALLAPLPLTAYRLWRVRRSFVYRRVFSNATISLAYGSASALFHAVPIMGSGTAPGTGWHVLAWTGWVVCCGVLAWLINNGLLLGAIGLAERRVRFRDLFGNWEAAVADLIELSLAVTLALVVAINPVLMTLALPSVVLYRRYLMHAQLVAQARIDAKTGVLNAGTWRHEAEAEFVRALRNRAPLSLVMVTIDHFDSVQETAGSLAGDQVLRGIASTLTENLNDYHLIGRFRGDEFAVLLPQTSVAEAKRISERLRDHIAGEPIAIEDGSHAGFVFRLTVSIGIAVLDQSRRVLAELIGAADVALSEAKSTGRNKVCVMAADTAAPGPADVA